MRFFFFLVGFRFEFRALCTKKKKNPPGAITVVHFALAILEMGFHELFVQVGFKP
jgi:hypothetical protein